MAGDSDKPRQPQEHYPTPHQCTEALLRVWRPPQGSVIWDPCCGTGGIATPLRKWDYRVLTSDIKEYPGFKPDQIGNFLELDNLDDVDYIWCNPPFLLAADFIRHIMEFETVKLVMLLKATYWHAKSRFELFRKWEPQGIYPLTWRPDFLCKGGPTMDVMWCIWDDWERRYRPLLK